MSEHHDPITNQANMCCKEEGCWCSDVKFPSALHLLGDPSSCFSRESVAILREVDKHYYVIPRGIWNDAEKMAEFVEKHYPELTVGS